VKFQWPWERRETTRRETLNDPKASLYGSVLYCRHCRRKTTHLRAEGGWWLCGRCHKFADEQG
jgi:ribosomal protein L37AE/L43A